MKKVASLLTRALWAITLCGCLMVAACDFSISDFDTDATPETPVDSVIRLSRVNGHAPMPADGRSTDTLIAVLPADANERQITFSLTHGAFEITNAKEVKIRAEERASPDRLEARAVFRSDTVAVRAMASASIGEFRDTLNIQFQKFAPIPH